MENAQEFECDTPDCAYWKDGACTLPASVTIQEHHCTNYEERIDLSTGTVTIEVSGGMVQNVYASPDLPQINVDVIDRDSNDETDEERISFERRLALIEETQNHIY